jgi:histidinol-phosphate aminotransferase
MQQYPHLIIIRTLSKAFGLAAVRCGFLLAHDSVMTYINRLIAPYPIADPSAEIALKALSPTGLNAIQQQTNELIQVRDWFIEQVNQLDTVKQVYSSDTNFVLINYQHGKDLFTHLATQGIITRNQTHEAALGDCVRITIGSKESMLDTLNVLKKITN